MRHAVVVCLVAAAAVAYGPAGAAPPPDGPPMLGGPLELFPELVAVDAHGGRYVAGTFNVGTRADFDPGAGTDVRSAVGWTDAFVTKFDERGRRLWTQTFGGTSEESAHSILLAGDTLYVGGGFRSDDAGFGGAKGAISSRSADDSMAAAYVMALDAATGAPRASFGTGGVVTFGSPVEGHANAKGIALADGTLFVAGDFISDDFGVGGAGAVDLVGATDGFVAAVDPITGAARTSFGAGGVQALAGSADDVVNGVVATAGTVYVVGQTGSADFGVGGAGAVAASGPSDGFVVALDAASGAPATSFAGDGIFTLGGPGFDDARAVGAGGGRVYVTGLATGAEVVFDGGSAPRPTLGGRDVYVLALDAATGTPALEFAGGVQWFGSARDDDARAAGICVLSDSVYVAGACAPGLGFGVGGKNQTGRDAAAFVFGLDGATGEALPGFGRDGVAYVVPGVDRVFSVTGFGGGSSAVALLGEVRNPTWGVRVGTDCAFEAGAAHADLPGIGSYAAFLDPATGAPLNMNVPVLRSPPIFSQNPAVVGRPVTARIAVGDAKSLGRIDWYWGEETRALGRTHTYRSPGTYRVRADAFGPRGRTSSEIATLVVVRAGAPSSDVTQAAARLAFAGSARDSIVVKGRTRTDGVSSPAGKEFTIDFGGVRRSFTLDASGRSPRGAESVVVSASSRGVAKFVVRLRGSYASFLADEGMTADRADRRFTPTLVSVTLGDETYSETAPLLWTNAAGDSGVAR